MARLSGSFPLKFNGKVVGKAYIVGQDCTSITVDIAFDNSALLDSIADLIEHDQLPDMSFGFETKPLEPKGLMQVMQPTPVNWDDLRENLAGITQEERNQNIRDYIQARYARLDKD